MSDSTEEAKPLPERIYRLRLLDGLMIATRRGYAVEPRLVVEDLLLLNRKLPYPASEDELGQMGLAVESVLARCQSETVRGMDRCLLALIIRTCYAASTQPYVPTLDELALV
jgi:hypothetical protein